MCAGRKRLADGGMQTIMMPDDELVRAADWCWNRFIGMKGRMPHIDKVIEIYTNARQVYKDYPARSACRFDVFRLMRPFHQFGSASSG
jgi:hypothetical protein